MQEVKMSGESLNIEQENISKLKEIFPEVFNEDKIDFDKLQNVLGNYIDTDEEKYRFTWNGKMNSLRLSQVPSTGTLRPFKDDSIDWDSTQNIYIEGDNLEVLKLLQNSYLNKIKMIYIDPPYNTGNDFIYSDDFRDNLENYKKVTGQIDDKGNSTSTNSDTSGRYHTNWLNMMYPRLRLARNLLTEDGVIFISIDENEVKNLKHICDEIFGEHNRLSTHHIQVRYDNKTLNEKNDWQPVMEYVFIYAKNANIFIPKKEFEDYSLDKFVYRFKELSEGETFEVKGRKVTVFKDGEWELIESNEGSTELLKETWVSGSIYSGTGNGQMVQNVIEPRVNKDGYGSLYKIDGLGEDGLGYRYFTGPQTEGATRCKMFSGVPLSKLEEIKNGTAKKYKSISNLCVFEDYSPDFGNIASEGGVKYNSGKKPIKMLKTLIDLCNLKDGDIVLDFFSGSATTGHAVMQLNSEDKIKRKFIMVQLPEKLSPEVKEQKNTYEFLLSINKPPLLSEVGKERLRRSGNKIKEKYGIESQQLSINGTTSQVPDIGFKVFKLDTSNIKKWNPETKNLERSLLDQINNYVEGRSEEDALYEIILKNGLPLTVPVEELDIKGKKVYSIGMGALIVCLDNNITLDIADEIANISTEFEDKSQVTVVFKDNGFANDSVKTNIKETIRGYGIGKFVTV